MMTFEGIIMCISVAFWFASQFLCVTNKWHNLFVCGWGAEESDFSNDVHVYYRPVSLSISSAVTFDDLYVWLMNWKVFDSLKKVTRNKTLNVLVDAQHFSDPQTEPPPQKLTNRINVLLFLAQKHKVYSWDVFRFSGDVFIVTWR